MKYKYLLFFIFLILYKSGFSQHYLGFGASYHFTTIVNYGLDIYLPTESVNGKLFSTTKKLTPRYSFSLNYGKQLSPKFIFFTGFQKIGFGQKFVIVKTEINDSGIEPIMTNYTYKSDLQLNYIKVPIKLYWKHAKNKKFGTFLSLSFDFGYLTSAKFEQNGVVYNYKEKMNPYDVNYTLMFGIRYDTDKSLYNIGFGVGDGLSDVENKEKFGVTTLTPAVNSFFGFFLSYNYKFN